MIDVKTLAMIAATGSYAAIYGDFLPGSSRKPGLSPRAGIAPASRILFLQPRNGLLTVIYLLDYLDARACIVIPNRREFHA